MWKSIGGKIDVNLNFNGHLPDLCKKASRKISALARDTPFMRLSRRKLLMNGFFTSQFSYCPLILMCHSHNNNNRKINMLRERCLRIIYNDKQSSSLNYWIKAVLSQFTLETFKGLPLKCLGSMMNYHHHRWKTCSC